MTDELAYGNREIADLLPWYETGRLSAADRLRVEAALATDPALRQELVLVREELTATIAVNEAQGTPSRQAVDRLFAALDGGRQATPVRFNVLRFVSDRLGALRPQTMAWGAMAACVLVLLQAGIILHLTSGGPGGAPAPEGAVYSSASVHPDRALDGPTLLVSFAPNASAGAIQKLLEDNSLSVVSGPAAGYFSVRVGSRDAAGPKVDEVIARLNEHRDVVSSVMVQSPPD